MEIRIRTAKEFRDSHVTIEIVADDAGEAADIARSVVRDCEGSGCPRLADERERVEEYFLLVDQANVNQAKLADKVKRLGDEHQRELADLRDKMAEELRAQAYAQNDRAASLQTQLAESRKLVADLSVRRAQALSILSTKQMEADMREGVTKLSVRLVNGIMAAREKLRGTSQA